jgi:hypothetical protein
MYFANLFDFSNYGQKLPGILKKSLQQNGTSTEQIKTSLKEAFLLCNEEMKEAKVDSGTQKNL